MTTTTRSQALYERAIRGVPGGAHSNTRAAPPVTYYARAAGSRLWDVDGQEWTDFVMGNAAILLGHGHPAITEAVYQALQDGLGAGSESELGIVAAERFLESVTTADQVRFTNTGTEAALHAVHLARLLTGKQGIAKFEGAYHGWWDDVYVSTWPDLSLAGPATRPVALPGAGGLRRDSNTTVLPFNDLDAARTLLGERQHDLAALFVEPVMIDVGFIEPEPGYLQGLKDLCAEMNILLIFDELLTGFRLGPAGAQGRYGVTPDLSLWSKGLANGFPVAALAGRRELMERTAPGANNAPFIGTFNGFRPAMAACIATLELLQQGEVARQLDDTTQVLKQEFDALAREYGFPAQLKGLGGHIQPYFTDQPILDYRSASTSDASLYRHWAATLNHHHLLVVRGPLLHSAFSAAHTSEDIERYLGATRTAFSTYSTSGGS